MTIRRITTTEDGRYIRLVCADGYMDVTDAREAAVLKRSIDWARKNLPADELYNYIEYQYEEGELASYSDTESYNEYCGCMEGL